MSPIEELRAAARSMRDDHANGLWPDWVLAVADLLETEAVLADNGYADIAAGALDVARAYLGSAVTEGT